MDSAGTLRAGLARLQTFAERYAAGVQPRVEGEVSLDPIEGGATTNADLAAETAGGALTARVIWSEDGEDLAGCLFWLGDIAHLLGTEGATRTIDELHEEDVAALDASLRLAIEEGGDGEMPFDWTALEAVRADGVGQVLREVGAADAHERVRVTLHVGGGEQAFLLVPAVEGAPETILDVATAVAEPVAGASAEAPASAGEGRRPEPVPAGIPAVAPALARAAGFRNLDHLLDVRLPLTIRLGSTRMSLEDVLRLAPGSIVELDHGEDEPLEVLANGRVIARGDVVVVDERFGLRITEIGSAEDRLKASV